MQIEFTQIWQEFALLPYNGFIITLGALVLADIIFGFGRAFKLKAEGPDLIKGFAIFLMVVASYPFLTQLNGVIAGGKYVLVTFYIGYYLLSLFETFQKLGVPFPAGLCEKIAAIKGQPGPDPETKASVLQEPLGKGKAYSKGRINFQPADEVVGYFETSEEYRAFKHQNPHAPAIGMKEWQECRRKRMGAEISGGGGCCDG